MVVILCGNDFFSIGKPRRAHLHKCLLKKNYQRDLDYAVFFHCRLRNSHHKLARGLLSFNKFRCTVFTISEILTDSHFHPNETLLPTRFYSPSKSRQNSFRTILDCQVKLLPTFSERWAHCFTNTFCTSSYRKWDHFKCLSRDGQESSRYSMYCHQLTSIIKLIRG